MNNQKIDWEIIEKGLTEGLTSCGGPRYGPPMIRPVLNPIDEARCKRKLGRTSRGGILVNQEIMTNKPYI
jgi:uncharacterized membrane protein